MDTATALWFAGGWCLAGFVNGITGFGAAMVAMPFVTQAMDITVAVPACSLLVLIASLEQGWRYRGNTDWRRVLPVMIGTLPGALAGFFILRHLSPAGLQAALGAFLLLYAVWGLFFEGGKLRVISRLWGYATGFFSTLFGTAFSFNGPPLAVYTSLSGWGKEASKAGLAMTFIVSCVLVIAAQACAGAHSMTTIIAMLIGTPATIAGAWLGFKVSRHMGDNTYRKLLFAFIACTGANFLWQVCRPLL